MIRYRLIAVGCMAIGKLIWGYHEHEMQAYYDKMENYCRREDAVLVASSNNSTLLLINAIQYPDECKRPDGVHRNYLEMQ